MRMLTSSLIGQHWNKLFKLLSIWWLFHVIESKRHTSSLQQIKNILQPEQRIYWKNLNEMILKKFFSCIIITIILISSVFYVFPRTFDSVISDKAWQKLWNALLFRISQRKKTLTWSYFVSISILTSQKWWVPVKTFWTGQCYFLLLWSGRVSHLWVWKISPYKS